MSINLLVGANRRDAVAWCDEHGMSRQEIGRTVFATRFHYDEDLRGRRGPVFITHHLPSDPRPFSEDWLSRDRHALRVAHHLNDMEALR